MAIGILVAIAIIFAALFAISGNYAAVLVATGVSLVSGATWLGLGKLEQKFYQSHSLPSRNQG